MWGKTRDEALGKNCLELGYEPWHAEMHDREIEQVVATRQADPRRGAVHRDQRPPRIYDYIFVPVIGPEGEGRAVAGTTRDVTERQSRAAARASLREADRAQGRVPGHARARAAQPAGADPQRLAAAAMHEPPSTSTARRSREMIERQVNHLVRLVDDLLDVSRISRGKIELRNERVDLRRVLDDAVEAAQPLIEAARPRPARVDCRTSRCGLDGDPTRLAQVFANLLNNAAKYTPTGGTITLRAGRDGDEVAISRARHRHRHRARECMPQIFEMFTQVDSRASARAAASASG